jgi:hypothetical protein
MTDKTYIVHESPALMSAQQYIAHVDLAPFGLEGELEQLWLGDLGDGVYELRCIPFRAYGLSLLDRVAVVNDMVSAVIQPSGHRTLRALIVPEPAGASTMAIGERFTQLARQEKLLFEWSGDRHVAIDFPPDSGPQSISDFVVEQKQAGNVYWEWSDSELFRTS